MGVIANTDPDAFAAVLAGVPFVDALNTILDPTTQIALTQPIRLDDVVDLLRGHDEEGAGRHGHARGRHQPGPADAAERRDDALSAL